MNSLIYTIITFLVYLLSISLPTHCNPIKNNTFGSDRVSKAALRSGVFNNPAVFGYAYTKNVNETSIPWNTLTHLVLAFFDIDSQGGVRANGDNLKSIVNKAQKHGIKVLASVGGDGTASSILGMVVKNKQARYTLARSLVETISKYNIDGVDYDYEFPSTQADIDGLYNALLVTRNEMNKRFGSGSKILTTTLFSSKGKFGPEAPYQKNNQRFSDIVDYGLLMAYDFFGSWSEVCGPNSPFNDVPGYPGLSFRSSISEWIKTGWDPKKLVAGLAFYGRASKASVSEYSSVNQYMPRLGSALKSGPVLSLDSAWAWADLRDPNSGALITTFKPNKGWERHWDNRTMTPWLLHRDTQTYIGYDDPKSLDIKSDHVIKNGLGGLMVWMIGYDYKDELTTVLVNYKAKCEKLSRIDRPLKDNDGDDSDGDGYGDSDDDDEKDYLSENEYTSDNRNQSNGNNSDKGSLSNHSYDPHMVSKTMNSNRDMNSSDEENLSIGSMSKEMFIVPFLTFISSALVHFL